MSAFRADDRVLLLVVPDLDSIAVLGRILSQGVLVAIASRAEVDGGRQALAEFDNIMFVEADGKRIPWRDAYFTKVVVDENWSGSAEVARVLAPGGTVMVAGAGGA